MKFQLPFKKADDSAYTAKELIDKLADEPAGHYLLSNNSFWHGGVHFTATTERPEFKELPVRCIADGEVVAYRINKKYEELDMTPPKAEGGEAVATESVEEKKEVDDPNKHRYSTSFCLVKHEYESPGAAIKTLPEAEDDKKILIVTNSKGLTRWEEKNGSKQGRFVENVLFEVIKEEKEGTLYWAQGYELDNQGERVKQADGTSLVYWMNTGSTNNKQYNSAKPVEKPERVDWNDLESVTTEATDDQVYSYNPAVHPAPKSPEHKIITVPKGTQVTLISGATTSTTGGRTYYQAKANVSLSATYQKKKVENGLLTEKTTHAAGETLWIALTDKKGNTVTDSKGKPAVKPDPNTNKLTFYSLYMHLLPWESYDCNQPQKDEEETKTYIRITATNGLTLRNKANVNSSSIVKDAKGVTRKAPNKQLLEVIDEVGNPSTVSELQLTHVYLVDDKKKRSDQQSYWINTGKKGSEPKPYGSYIEVVNLGSSKKVQAIPEYWFHKATVKCIARFPVTTLIKTKDGFGESGKVKKDSIFSYSMPLQGAQNMGEGKEKQQLILCKLEEGSLIDNKGAASDIAVGGTFYVLEKEIKDPKFVERRAIPNKFDEVVPCNEPEPFKVSAGDCMGYMGLYETATDTAGEKDSKHLLHLEVFTKDDQRFNDFFNNKAKVTAGKQYLKINKGAKLIIGKSADKPSETVTGLPLHYFKDASTPTLKRDWFWEKSKTTLSKIKEVEWYKIQITGLPKETFGWIKKGSSTKKLGQFDLKELGFKVIEETDESTNGDLFVDETNVSVQGGGEEVKDFFQEIHKEIDNLGRGDGKGDEKLTPDEIQAAYKDEDLRETLQKIIGYHPTEWQKELDAVKVVAERIKTSIISGKDEDEKTKLDPIKNDPDKIIIEFSGQANLNNLKQEKDRIKKLVFWDKVSELSTNKVYHFHSVKIIESLVSNNYPTQVAPIGPKYRSHFVLHSTAGDLSKSYIQAIKNNGQAHKYIMKDGEVIIVWPFTRRDVYATKMERKDRDTNPNIKPTIVWGSEIIDESYKVLLGQMFHVELNYAEKVNGVRDAPTEAQYQALAKLYIKAAILDGYWPRIVPHIEVDRGIKNGHRDPTDFDYDHFYQILRDKEVPIDTIPHFEHKRYWHYNKGKEPLKGDITSWPPRLSGDPHAKK